MSAGYIRRFTTRWPRPIACPRRKADKNNFGTREGLGFPPFGTDIARKWPPAWPYGSFPPCGPKLARVNLY